AALGDYVKQTCPPGATVETRLINSAPLVLVPTDASAMRAAAQALAAVFGKPPVYTRMGGSIPVVTVFMQALGAPVVMMCFGLPEENLHPPNEKMKLDNIYQGIAAATDFLRRLRHEQGAQ